MMPLILGWNSQLLKHEKMQIAVKKNCIQKIQQEHVKKEMEQLSNFDDQKNYGSEEEDFLNLNEKYPEFLNLMDSENNIYT